MNQQVYRRVMEQSLFPWARATLQNNFVLVQDNPLSHTVRATRDFPENQDVEVMDWPSKSPDMNPKEHRWEQMAVHINDIDNPPVTAVQLRMAVQQIWVTLRPVRLRTVRSMPRRMCVVLAARGGHKHY